MVYILIVTSLLHLIITVWFVILFIVVISYNSYPPRVQVCACWTVVCCVPEEVDCYAGCVVVVQMVASASSMYSVVVTCVVCLSSGSVDIHVCKGTNQFFDIINC